MASRFDYVQREDLLSPGAVTDPTLQAALRGNAGLSKFSKRLSRRTSQFAPGFAVVNGASSYTYAIERAVDGDFTSVRAWVFSHHSGAWTISKLIIAPAQSSGMSGTGLTWSSFNFNNPKSLRSASPSLNVTSTPSLSNSAATAFGASVPDIVPTVSVSDWLSLNSIARLDIPAAKSRLVQLRMQMGGAYPIMGTGFNAVNTAASAYDRSFLGASYNGDGVTSPNSVSISPGVSGNAEFPVILEFKMKIDSHGITVGAVGDSTYKGFINGGAQTLPWVEVASFSASTDSFLINTVNFGTAGASMSSSIARGHLLLDTVLPDVLIIQTASKNDDSADMFDAFLLDAVALAGRASSLGVRPVLCTATPAGYSNPLEARRVAHNAEVARLCAANSGEFYFFDFDKSIYDPATPSQILAAYTGDGTHLTDAGNTKAANDFKSQVLSKIIAEYTS